MNPFRTGLVLSITVALFYALCTVAWVVAPGPFLSFMNDLFHGMNFTGMVKPAPFAWSGFGTALFILAVWAFCAGAFFGWLRDRLVPR